MTEQPLSMHPTSAPISPNLVDDDPVSQSENEDPSGEAERCLQNEKTIISGYLYKKGEKRRTWKRRWFVLRAKAVSMYKDEKEYKLLRCIRLDDIHKVEKVNTQERYDEKGKHKFVFVISTPDRTYWLEAINEADLTRWIKSLNEAQQEMATTDDLPPCPSPVDRQRRLSAEGVGSGGGRSQSIPTPPMDIPKARVTSPSLSTTPHSDISAEGELSRSLKKDGSSSEDEREAVNEGQEDTQTPNLGQNSRLFDGFLLKQGRNKAWKKRWFVLREKNLAYYKDKREYTAQVVIPLARIIDTLQIEPVGKKQFCFKIVLQKRTYTLRADTREGLDQWLEQLDTATRHAKESPVSDEIATASYPTRHRLSTISESSRSSLSSDESVEKNSLNSEVSGAGGVGGAGGALGKTPTIKTAAQHRLGLSPT